MSERLPYEEQLPQQLRDFPLLDENAAWADMKRRLEEDDDDGVIIWWRRGCAGWGLLLLALIVSCWLFLIKNKDDDRKNEPVSRGIEETTADSAIKKRSVPYPDIEHDINKNGTAEKDTNISPLANYPRTPDTLLHSSAGPAPGGAITKASSPGENKKSGLMRTSRSGHGKHPEVERNKKKDPPGGKADSPAVSTSEQSISTRPDDSGKSGQAGQFIAGDSAKSKVNDSAVTRVHPALADSTMSDSVKKNSKQKTAEYFWSAGLALNQQLPVAGQKAVPYSSQGRGFSLADYIPSVYLRFNKKDRWFIQGEFRYGAPQYNKPVTYSRTEDTIPGGNSVITEKQLQKTYYHQLPVSFNYYVLPQWSVGTGIVWNRFVKSVYQRSVRDAQSVPDSFLVKEVFVGKDSANGGLSTSYYQALIESQYQWKKFSFGARYTFGLNPYLRFTLPGEPERKERNQSLQLFIRYQLFSKKSGK